MEPSLASAFARNFLGNAPEWYKLSIVGFLILNPLVFFLGGDQGPAVAGWMLMLEFIFTLVMALKCYPLQPGGLLIVEAIAIGLTSAESVYEEAIRAFPVILLLIFMVTGIYFMRELLLFVFTRILLRVRSHTLLSLLVCMTTALLSAFLDALTVVAVIITVASSFFAVYHRFASGKPAAGDHDVGHDGEVADLHRSDLEVFRGFLRGLMMHASVGTALGGVTTMVGEPQNLIIAEHATWDFAQFFHAVAPVSMPVLVVGLLTCLCVERFRWFGYGNSIPPSVRNVLEEYEREQTARRTSRDRAVMIVQAVAAVFLVVALGLQFAEVGLIGLMIIIVATSFNGITDEHRLGKAFESAMPFTALLVVFFAVVAVLHDQHLFEPLVTYVLQQEGRAQIVLFYIANGLLSAISDNVFVATIYITEIKSALLQGAISKEQFDALAVAINTGTNIPSIATPNGQAALLFLLTSALAPLIRLSYGRMVLMALPYTVTMTLTGLLAVAYLL